MNFFPQNTKKKNFISKGFDGETENAIIISGFMYCIFFWDFFSEVKEQ